MARTDTLGNFLTDVCNAVREKTGETGTIKASELDTKIQNISSGDVPTNAKIEITEYDEDGYPTKVIVKDTVSSKCEYLFKCGSVSGGVFERITQATIPSDWSIIPQYMFEATKKLESVNIPDTVTQFGKNCFSDCYELKLDRLPPNTKSFGQAAFAYCRNITISELPETVTNMSGNVFQGCKNITI